MGGNTYNRKYYSDDEIQELLKNVSGFKSLFKNNVIYDDEVKWRANISRHLDSDSCNRFFYAMEEPHFCNYCSKELTIKSYSYVGWNKGFSKYCPQCTKLGVWRTNLSEDALKDRGEKISEAKRKFYRTEKGKKTAKSNGKKISSSLKEFHKTELGAAARQKSAKLNSEIMRNRILNGTFTPNSNNRNTHWDSEYNGKKYRSSWEAVYQYFYPDALYEQLRIEYNYNNRTHIYIVDFLDHKRQVVCEVKPKEMCSDKRTQRKLDALYKWANENGYKVEIFSEENILLNPEPDYTLFDENTTRKLRKLYEKVKN